MGHRGCICERGGGSFASRGRRPILCRDGTFNQWLRATSCLWRCRQRSRDDKDDNRHSRSRWPSSRTGVVLFIDLVDLDRDLYRGGVEKAKSHDERGVKQSSGSAPGPRSLPTRLRGREPLEMQAAVLCCSSSDRAALPLLLNNNIRTRRADFFKSKMAARPLILSGQMAHDRLQVSRQRGPDGSQPRSIRRQFPPVGRQRGTTQKAHHSTAHLYERTSFFLTTEHSRRCAASARNLGVESDTVPPPLTMKLSSSDDFLEMAPSRPPIWGRRHTDDSASRLSAHAAPLVSPRSSSSTHGKLCDDPITGRLHDGSLLRMFQRRGRGSRLNL